MTRSGYRAAQCAPHTTHLKRFGFSALHSGQSARNETTAFRRSATRPRGPLPPVWRSERGMQVGNGGRWTSCSGQTSCGRAVGRWRTGRIGGFKRMGVRGLRRHQQWRTRPLRLHFDTDGLAYDHRQAFRPQRRADCNRPHQRRLAEPCLSGVHGWQPEERAEKQSSQFLHHYTHCSGERVLDHRLHL